MAGVNQQTRFSAHLPRVAKEGTSMTQDEIIEMAQECGLIGMRPHLDGIYSEALVAFAKLIGDRKQEEIIKVIERLGTWAHIEEVVNAIRERGQA
jgi:hypothetical protein